MVFRLGPLTLISSSLLDSYRTVAARAYALHQIIWMHGENSPPFGSGVEEADEQLAEALSRIPPPDS